MDVIFQISDRKNFITTKTIGIGWRDDECECIKGRFQLLFYTSFRDKRGKC